MEFEKVIKERTATRKYSNEKVEKELIQKILEASRLAPTAKNNQPQKIYVIESNEGLSKVDECTQCRYGAPLSILVCSDKNISFQMNEYNSYECDACIVATHMMLEATNLDLANIWVRLFDINKVQQVFNLPSNIVPICFLMIGHKTLDHRDSPFHNTRKDLSQIVEYL